MTEEKISKVQMHLNKPHDVVCGVCGNEFKVNYFFDQVHCIACGTTTKVEFISIDTE